MEEPAPTISISTASSSIYAAAALICRISIEVRTGELANGVDLDRIDSYLEMMPIGTLKRVGVARGLHADAGTSPQL